MQIDTLRGLFLLIMTFAHLLLWPFRSLESLLPYFYEPFGFFTAAEGFFLLSGLTAGFGYASYANNLPLIYAKAKQRTKELYWANTLPFTALCSLVFFMPSFFVQWQQHPWFSSLYANQWTIWALSLPFLSQQGYFDILPVFCIFFAVIPAIFFLIYKKGLRFLLIFSACLWLFGQWHPLEKLELILKSYEPLIRLGWFDPFSWQFLFVLGIVFGYCHKLNKNLDYLKKPSIYLLLGAIVFCCSLFFLKHGIITIEAFDLLSFSDVRTLGIVRLSNFLFFSWLLFLTVQHFPRIFSIKTIAMLGRHSLSVFMYHCLLCYFLGAFMIDIDALPIAISTLYLAASVLSLWLIPSLRETQRAVGMHLLRRTKLSHLR